MTTLYCLDRINGTGGKQQCVPGPPLIYQSAAKMAVCASAKSEARSQAPLGPVQKDGLSSSDQSLAKAPWEGTANHKLPVI